MSEKSVLNFEDIKAILGNVGRDRLYTLLAKAYKTGKPFPVITKNPYRVPKELFMEALNSGKVRL